MGREVKNSQANNKILWGTSDHRPAAGIHGVFVPIAQNPMWVMQFASNSYQSHHWRTSKGINALESTHKGRTRTED